MNIRLTDPTFTLFVLQRASGALLALLLLVHLVTIIYAVQGGLTVAEIVDRVRGNMFWIVFYAAFGLTAAVHATIGLRKILTELFSINHRIIDLLITVYLIGAFWLCTEAISAIW